MRECSFGELNKMRAITKSESRLEAETLRSGVVRNRSQSLKFGTMGKE